MINVLTHIDAISEIIPTEHSMTLADGTELFYRAWLPHEPTRKALVIFHRGHEHSGRLQDVVREVRLRDVAVFVGCAQFRLCKAHLGLGLVARLGCDEVHAVQLALPLVDGRLTLGQSREIRRHHWGPKVRSTANLFGTKDSGAILYRKAPSGERPKDTDPIRLTKEGERLAKEFRRLQGQAA